MAGWTDSGGTGELRAVGSGGSPAHPRGRRRPEVHVSPPWRCASVVVDPSRGLSRTPVDDDWGQIYAFLPAEPWVRAAHEVPQPFVAHASWLEIGWAVRRPYWGQGYASEMGRAGLAHAFDVLGAEAVVSCTVRHNVQSRGVMARIGMRYAGEIRSRGLVEGADGEQDDAPFAVSVMRRDDWIRSAPTGAIV